MYSFGSAGGWRARGLGPGPAYRIDRVTREGNMSSPAWSFGARYRPRSGRGFASSRRAARHRSRSGEKRSTVDVKLRPDGGPAVRKLGK